MTTPSVDPPLPATTSSTDGHDKQPDGRPRSATSEPALGADGVENLKLLMDYTKFHLGIYITLFSAIVLAIEKNIFSSELKWALPVAALLLVLAGAAGGVIGSSIPDAASFSSFRANHLGPLWIGRRGLRYQTWAALEHLFFWLAILVVAVTLVLPRLFGC
jgi:hypothetical protein